MDKNDPLKVARARMRDARAALQTYLSGTDRRDPRFKELYDDVESATREYFDLLKDILKKKYDSSPLDDDQVSA
jgi:hypothetical protein